MFKQNVSGSCLSSRLQLIRQVVNGSSSAVFFIALIRRSLSHSSTGLIQLCTFTQLQLSPCEFPCILSHICALGVVGFHQD